MLDVRQKPSRFHEATNRAVAQGSSHAPNAVLDAIAHIPIPNAVLLSIRGTAPSRRDPYCSCFVRSVAEEWQLG